MPNVSESNDERTVSFPIHTNSNPNNIQMNKNRDLMIRKAFKDQDISQSRRAHDEKSRLLHKHSRSHNPNYTNSSLNTSININDDIKSITELNNITTTKTGNESHKQHGEYVKSIIYGGLDGVFTTFALVSGFQGAGTSFKSPTVVLVFGFANVVADAISMGIGDFLSSKAENDFAISERAREEWEFDNYMNGEINEMIEIYVNKGIEYQDACVILNLMSKYKDFFIDHMMIQELEIYPINVKSNDYDKYQPIKNGIVTFISFLLFGSVPLLGYVILQIFDVDFDENSNVTFLLCIALSVTTLMILGFVKVEYHI